jgi:hypothetical protein
MTHPVYSQIALEALSTSEVKTIANQLGAIPDGDRRVKQTWVSAVLDHQTKFSPAKVEAMEAHIQTVMARSASVTTDASELPDELPAIDTYIPTPRTHADDVAFAAAMGLTYDDVFGEPLSEVDESVGDIPEMESLTASGQKIGAHIVLIALAFILYAVCLVPIGMAIVIYRAVGAIRGDYRPWGNSKREHRIDYFSLPV